MHSQFQQVPDNVGGDSLTQVLVFAANVLPQTPQSVTLVMDVNSGGGIHRTQPHKCLRKPSAYSCFSFLVLGVLVPPLQRLLFVFWVIAVNATFNVKFMLMEMLANLDMELPLLGSQEITDGILDSCMSLNPSQL